MSVKERWNPVRNSIEEIQDSQRDAVRGARLHKLQPNAQVFHSAADTVFGWRVFIGFHDGRSATPVQMLLNLLHLFVWLQQLDFVINLQKYYNYMYMYFPNYNFKAAAMCLQA